MNLENIIAVSGMPGLFKLLATRPNGLMVESMETGKRNFVSMRKHQFTPLESVGIYTYADVEDLKLIFKKMKDKIAEQPLPDQASSSSDYHEYFRSIVPDFNEDRVYLSDIKKVVKWYEFLDQRGLLTADSEEEE